MFQDKMKAAVHFGQVTRDLTIANAKSPPRHRSEDVKTEDQIPEALRKLFLIEGCAEEEQANQTGQKAEAKKANDNKGEADAKAKPTQSRGAFS
nr:hypothetical protein BaRGS_014445 [Batillaria attramentaria]